MHSRRFNSIVIGVILPLTAVASVMLSDSLPSTRAAAAGGGDRIRVPGVVRDFRRGDSDIVASSSLASGHVAGNVAMSLAADQSPVLAGGGFRVATQWRERGGHPIAPHLYMWGAGGPTTIPVASPCPGPSKGVFDSYDSTLGPYGGPNIGPTPTFLVGAPMPTISVPAALSALVNQGNMTFSGASAISADLHCNRFDGSGTITINGNISILCEDTFALSNSTNINIGATSSLRLYLKKGGSSWNHSVINGITKDPKRLVVFNMSTIELMIHNHATIYATFISPNASLAIKNHGEVFGTFWGKYMDFDNHGDFHLDRAAPRDACGVVMADTAGSKGGSSSGGIPSAAAFAKWYHDMLGSNLSARHVIDLVRGDDGIYSYLEDEFHPIDGLLYGNEGQAHNYYLTYTFGASFVHSACNGQFFEFEGADDAWLFVDGMLAMDLGGVNPGTPQYVDMDRLGLVGGRIYRLQFFYAQRQEHAATFRVRTNINLIAEPLPAVSAVGD